MFSRRFLLIGFIVAYLSFLAASVPVSLVWQWTSAYVPQNVVQFSDFKGSLWRGQTKLKTRGEQFDLHWQINSLKLLLGKLELQLNVEQPFIKLDGVAGINMFGRFQVENLSGYIDDKLISMIDLPRGTVIQGRLWLDSLQFSGVMNQSVDSIWGTANWSGGPVQFLAGRTTLSADVPRLFAELTSEEDIRLTVVDSNQLEWINGNVDQEGWLNLQVLQNVADVLELPVQGGSQNILFEMKQKVY